LPSSYIHAPWNIPKEDKKQYASTDTQPIDCPKYTDVALAKKQRQEHLDKRAKERVDSAAVKKST